jgi:Skp family chaperone for outer membrane proteins
MNKSYVEELKNIEKELTELKKKKQAILDEEKRAKEAKKSERYKEVEEAYNKFIDLLDAYEQDFNEGFCVKISGEFLEN